MEWGRMYVCVNWVFIRSDNGLWPVRCPSITSINADLMSRGPSGKMERNMHNKIWNKMHILAGKCVYKRRLRNDDHFVQASRYLNVTVYLDQQQPITCMATMSWFKECTDSWVVSLINIVSTWHLTSILNIEKEYYLDWFPRKNMHSEMKATIQWHRMLILYLFISPYI